LNSTAQYDIKSASKCEKTQDAIKRIIGNPCSSRGFDVGAGYVNC